MGVHSDNGQENGSYYLIMAFTIGLHRENGKMEATVLQKGLHWDYIGVASNMAISGGVPGSRERQS